VATAVLLYLGQITGKDRCELAERSAPLRAPLPEYETQPTALADEMREMLAQAVRSNLAAKPVP
jgi:hypothetical protein